MADDNSAEKKKKKTFIEVEIECVERGMMTAEDVYNNYGTVIVRKKRLIEGKHLSQMRLAEITKIKVMPPSKKEEKKEEIRSIKDYPEHEAKLNAAKILVVDDSMAARIVVGSVLEEAGFNVVGEAENGHVAIEKTAELKPTVVILDILMPMMDGIAAIPGILEASPGVKIIMVSSMGYKDRIVEALEAGAMQFITKPFKPNTLTEATIKTILE